MATTSLTPELSMLPQPSTQPLSSAKQGMCFQFDEATKTLPMFLQSNDEHKQHELSAFLSQVDVLHKSDGLNVSATSILNYIQHILEAAPEIGEMVSQDFLTRSEAFLSLPQLPIQLPIITGDIATEIVCKVIGYVNSHNITISVLDILHQYSWEAKVALTVTTYILTFGDFGLNLCAESKVTLNDISMFVKQLLEITSCIVEFEKLPKAYMTSTDRNVKDARTHFVVAVYWIIRAIIENSVSHIMTMSSKGYKFGTAISPPFDEKLGLICSHLKTKLRLLQELIEEKVDIEAYNKIKEIVQQNEHSDNFEVLNALISSIDDAPRLYDTSAKKRVHLNELQGKYVLLLIANLEDADDHEVCFIDQFHAVFKQELDYKWVFIPIVDRLLQRHTDVPESKYTKLRSLVDWYIADHPRMISNEVLKFFSDDWNFTGESIIVVLDPRGNVINQNAFPMILIWMEDAFPFTTTREATLWKMETLRLHLIVHGIEPLLLDWLSKDKYIFVYGSVNTDWISSFSMMVQSVSRTMEIPIETFYVGKSHKEELVRRVVCNFPLNLGSSLPGSMLTWFFWKRIESMIYSMAQHEKVDAILFQEIQRLYNYDKYDIEWAILAKGSEILVIGNGNVVLSTLGAYQLWQEAISKDGFGVAFTNHYQELYQRELVVHRLELPITPLTDLKNYKTIYCPDCHSQMKKCLTFVCDHPPWKYNKIKPS